MLCLVKLLPGEAGGLELRPKKDGILSLLNASAAPAPAPLMLSGTRLPTAGSHPGKRSTASGKHPGLLPGGAG